MSLPPSKHPSLPTSSPQPPSSQSLPPTQQPTLSKSDARLVAWHRRMKPWYAAILTFTLVVGGVVTGAAGKETYQRWRRERKAEEIAAEDSSLHPPRTTQTQPSHRADQQKIPSPQIQTSISNAASSTSTSTPSTRASTDPNPGNHDKTHTLHNLTSSMTSLQIRRHELLTIKQTLETKRERIRERIRLKEDEKSRKNSVARGVDVEKDALAEGVNGRKQKGSEVVKWDGVEVMGRIGPQGFIVEDVIDPSAKGGGGG
jgi:hypothetical protein